MNAYQQTRWAPAPARYIGQAPAPAPAPSPAPAPMAERSGFMDWGAEPVQTFLITQGVALAYAATAAYLHGKKGEFVDRVLLGLGALAFGGASWAGFRMAAMNYPTRTLPTQITGYTMGGLDGLTAVGAAIAAIRPKPRPVKEFIEAAVQALPG